MIIKQTKLKTLIDDISFINLFDYKLLNYISLITKDVNEKYKVLKKLYFENIFTFIDFQEHHSFNGVLKIWKSSRFGWPIEMTNFMKGTSTRGKSRPEHSELMKVKMKGIDRGESFRKIKKIQNSSIDFKKKVLENKNIDVSSKTIEEIIELYSLLTSNTRKTTEFKIKKVKKFLKSRKYLGEYQYEKFVSKYNDIDITPFNVDAIYPEMMSIISCISMSRNSNMGKTKFFKTGFIKVKHCLNKTIIRYRSSWELKTIEFLEDKNVKYSYEPFYLEKEDGTLYLPDFLIEYCDEQILLEIKGFIRGTKGKLNEEMKINAAKKYCSEKQIKYVYLQKILTDINEIIN